LSVRTIARNTNFYDEITLFSHDLQAQENNAVMENDLGVDYAKVGNRQEAITHLQKSVDISSYPGNLFNLGYTYEQMRNLQKAQKYYSKAVNMAEKYYQTADTHSREREGDLDIYTRLAGVSLLSQDNTDAQKVSSTGLQYYPDSIILWEELAISEYKLHNQKDALSAIEKARTLAPGDLTNFLYAKIVNKEDIQPDMPRIILDQSALPSDALPSKDMKQQTNIEKPGESTIPSDSGSTHQYPYAIVQSFMDACTKAMSGNNNTQRCLCLINGIQKIYTFDQFKTYSEKAKTGYNPPEIQTITQECLK
jgi:tetratricopeptide (TPR) repeat protein